MSGRGYIAGGQGPSGRQKSPGAAPHDQAKPKSPPPADRTRKETWEGVGRQGVREVLGTRRVTLRAGTGRAAAKNLPQQVPTTKLTITKVCVLLWRFLLQCDLQVIMAIGNLQVMAIDIE